MKSSPKSVISAISQLAKHKNVIQSPNESVGPQNRPVIKVFESVIIFRELINGVSHPVKQQAIRKFNMLIVEWFKNSFNLCNL